MDVNPAPVRSLPVYLCLTHLEDYRTIPRAVEVQVRDRNPPAGIPLSNVTCVVVGIRDENVPFIVTCVCQVMRALGWSASYHASMNTGSVLSVTSTNVTVTCAISQLPTGSAAPGPPFDSGQ